MLGKGLEVYYPADMDTGQLFLGTQYFILGENIQSEL